MLKRIITILILLSFPAAIYSETRLSMRPVQAEMMFNGKLFSAQTYEYDSRGNLVKASENNYMENKTSYAAYKYNPDNRLIEIREYSGNHLDSIIVPEYDNEGKVIKEIYYSPDNKIVKYKTIEYKGSLVIRKNDYDASNVMHSYSVLKYKEGILDSMNLCSIDKYTMDIAMIYNNDRMIIEQKMKHSDIPDADLKRVYKYEKGDVTEASLREIFTN